jgi:hypothetical protein
MDLRGIKCEDVDGIHLARDWNWRDFANTAITFGTHMIFSRKTYIYILGVILAMQISFKLQSEQPGDLLCQLHLLPIRRMDPFLYCISAFSCKPIAVAALSKAWTVSARSNTVIVGSNPTQVCMRLFCDYIFLCVGSGLATGWPSVQGVIQTIYIIKKLRKYPRSEGL